MLSQVMIIYMFINCGVCTTSHDYVNIYRAVSKMQNQIKEGLYFVEGVGERIGPLVLVAIQDLPN